MLASVLSFNGYFVAIGMNGPLI